MNEERVCYNCGSGKYYAKGLCRSCYNRFRYNGTLGPVKRGRPLSENTMRILDLRKANIRQIDIAKQIGVSRQQVNRVVKMYTKPTNFEWIKAMTEDEMADWLGSMIDCEKVCPNRDICAAIHDECDGSVWYKWLREEVK